VEFTTFSGFEGSASGYAYYDELAALLSAEARKWGQSAERA
jgi:hypothetical protein